MRHPRLGILGGLAALCVGIGVAAAGVGHLLRSVPSASAADGIGPAVTGGVHPWVNLAGLTSGVDADTVIFDVPADRIFVMTGGCVNGSVATLRQDGLEKMHYNTKLVRCDNINSDQDNGPNLLRNGNAHIVFEPGTQVVISHPVPAAWSYYLEGYLARP